jgi:hypothetical protein
MMYKETRRHSGFFCAMSETMLPILFPPPSPHFINQPSKLILAFKYFQNSPFCLYPLCNSRLPCPPHTTGFQMS